jgi:hypothetical protein
VRLILNPLKRSLFLLRNFGNTIRSYFSGQHTPVAKWGFAFLGSRASLPSVWLMPALHLWAAVRTARASGREPPPHLASSLGCIVQQRRHSNVHAASWRSRGRDPGLFDQHRSRVTLLVGAEAENQVTKEDRQMAAALVVGHRNRHQPRFRFDSCVPRSDRTGCFPLQNRRNSLDDSLFAGGRRPCRRPHRLFICWDLRLPLLDRN